MLVQKNLFSDGVKFIILDEVDYMTKNAQQALRNLIQQYDYNVRFCLICNYISKIDYALQNEFIRLRFCQLPKKDINRFLKNIIEKEKLNINSKQLNGIQCQFKSDIRSMINFIQSHSNTTFDNTDIISSSFFEEIFNNLKKKKISLNDVCIKNNIRVTSFIIQFITYLVYNKQEIIDSNTLSKFKFIVHNNNIEDDYLINFFFRRVRKIIIIFQHSLF